MAGSEKIAQSRHTISRRGLLRGAGAFTGLGLVGGAWDSTKIQVRYERIYLPRWDADGFRVAHLSDLHANSVSQFDRAVRAVHLAIDANPDLIAISGDYLDFFTPSHVSHLERLLARLNSARCQVVTVFGNHDTGDLPMEQVQDMFRKFAVKFLRNHALEVNGVSVVGVDDAIYGSPNPGFIKEREFSKSLLGLWHEPDAVGQIPKKVSIQLSGHSHGGEICFPGGVPLHTPAMARLYTGGFYPLSRVPVYVSKGVATVGPCRLYCPPEISILTIYSSGDGPARSESM